MTDELYSIRMHATLDGEHLSGAEDLVGRTALEARAAALVQRALQHPRGAAEQIRVSVDLVDPARLQRGRLPSLRTLDTTSVAAARRAAGELLARAGVHPRAAADALRLLATGCAGAGRNMRGAMLVDSRTGARLEADSRRGVRVSRFGMTGDLAASLGQRLGALGLARPQVVEALLLAGKVAMHPAVLAELCWSDDPDYQAGYVCSRAFGYLRFPCLKPPGDPRGGRAFFIRPGSDVEQLVSWLEGCPVLFHAAAELHPPAGWEEYVRQLGE